MKANQEHKICGMCCMQIPKDARRCPYCHHFQYRLSMLMYHPAFAMLLACLPVAAMLIVFGTIFDQGEDYTKYADQIEIVNSEVVFGDASSDPTVAVIGEIRNKSDVAWDEIRFHADFFDATGRRVDVGQKQDYFFHLGAGSTSSFKLSFRREFQETNYVAHKVHVVTAKDAKARW